MLPEKTQNNIPISGYLVFLNHLVLLQEKTRTTMNVITKLMYSIHRILGTLLCILFLMWFLSAFVMMYHRFPRVSAKEKMQNAGYDNNAVTEDGMYAADNGVYTLVLSMADDNVMNISMNVVE